MAAERKSSLTTTEIIQPLDTIEGLTKALDQVEEATTTDTASRDILKEDTRQKETRKVMIYWTAQTGNWVSNDLNAHVTPGQSPFPFNYSEWNTVEDSSSEYDIADYSNYDSLSGNRGINLKLHRSNLYEDAPVIAEVYKKGGRDFFLYMDRFIGVAGANNTVDASRLVDRGVEIELDVEIAGGNSQSIFYILPFPGGYTYDFAFQTLNFTNVIGSNAHIEIPGSPGNFEGDYLAGNSARNRLEGRGGNDIILGRGGADVLMGGRHNDFVSGGDGDDYLSGGTDHSQDADSVDILTGGAGKDTFGLHRTGDLFTGVSVIEDFVIGEDRLDLPGYGPGGFGERVLELPIGHDLYDGSFYFVDINSDSDIYNWEETPWTQGISNSTQAGVFLIDGTDDRVLAFLRNQIADEINAAFADLNPTHIHLV